MADGESSPTRQIGTTCGIMRIDDRVSPGPLRGKSWTHNAAYITSLVTNLTTEVDPSIIIYICPVSSVWIAHIHPSFGVNVCTRCISIYSASNKPIRPVSDDSTIRSASVASHPDRGAPGASYAPAPSFQIWWGCHRA